MKKLGVLTIGFILFSWQTFAQDNKKGKDPDEQIIVNKKYDDNGNLIQFDSTYVHTWSSDSTGNFAFPDDFFAGNGFPDVEEFFKNFMGDSAMFGSNFPEGFGHMPFDDDEFFEQFHQHFPDSMMMGNTTFPNDSAMQFFFSGPGNLPPGFDSPDFDEFQKQLNEQLKKYPLNGFDMPQFKNEEQQKEWEALMEKHKKEIEALKKKWDENNR